MIKSEVLGLSRVQVTAYRKNGIQVEVRPGNEELRKQVKKVFQKEVAKELVSQLGVLEKLTIEGPRTSFERGNVLEALQVNRSISESRRQAKVLKNFILLAPLPRQKPVHPSKNTDNLVGPLKEKVLNYYKSEKGQRDLQEQISEYEADLAAYNREVEEYEQSVNSEDREKELTQIQNELANLEAAKQKTQLVIRKTKVVAQDI